MIAVKDEKQTLPFSILKEKREGEVHGACLWV